MKNDNTTIGALKKMVIAGGVFLVPSLILHAVDIQFQPVPKNISYSDKMEQLPSPVRIVLPISPSPIEKIGGEILKKHLKKRFSTAVSARHRMKTPFLLLWDTEKEPEFTDGTVISIDEEEMDQPEAYEIDAEINDNSAHIRIKGHKAGVLYGVTAFLEILRLCSLETGIVNSFPELLVIEDYPTMKVRMRGPLWQANKHLNYYLERAVWERLNFIYATIHKTPNLKSYVNEANKYGIHYSGALSYLHLSLEQKRALCPFNQADVALMEEYFRKAGKAGCKGLQFNFDDLHIFPRMLNHVRTCPLCSKKFRNLGKFQRCWIKKMVKIGNEYGVSHYAVCPTPYMKNSFEKKTISAWEKATEQTGLFDNYFRELTDDPFLKNVRVYHTDFRESEIEKLQKNGLQNYMFWYNGPWVPSSYLTWSTGISRLAWGWYCFEIDIQKGAIPIEGRIKDLSRISDLTTDVFINSGDSVALKICGAWLWDPRRLEAEKARASALSFVLGPGFDKDFEIYENNMMKLVAYFGAYLTGRTYECGTRIVGAPPANSAEERQKLLSCYKKAKSAFTRIKDKIILTKENPLTGPVLPDPTSPISPTPWLIRSMENDLIKVGEKMKILEKRVKAATEVPKIPATTSWSFDNHEFLEKKKKNGFKNIKIIGKPKKTVGINGKALLFEGGKFEYAKNGILTTDGKQEYAVFPCIKELEFADESFSVECWVKLNYYGNYQFVGDRASVRPIYKLKGWALGLNRKGKLLFVVDDGKNTSVASVKFLKAPWIPYAWNHLVGVRDRKRKELILYINGVEAARSPDKSSSITTGKQIVLGKDSYAGTFIAGGMDELNLYKKALSNDEVANCYQQVLNQDEENK